MKKGYIFLMDAVFAMAILMIGYMLISSMQVRETTEFPISHIPEYTIDVLATARVGDMCDGCACDDAALEAACNEFGMHNTNNSVLDYFGEIYEKDSSPDRQIMHDLFENMTRYAVDREMFGVAFSIDNDVVYSTEEYRDKSTNLIASKRVIAGFYEDLQTGEVYFWGPHVAEVIVWQK